MTVPGGKPTGTLARRGRELSRRLFRRWLWSVHAGLKCEDRSRAGTLIVTAPENRPVINERLPAAFLGGAFPVSARCHAFEENRALIVGRADRACHRGDGDKGQRAEREPATRGGRAFPSRSFEVRATDTRETPAFQVGAAAASEIDTQRYQE